METLIDEQIAALGQTKVLVALKPEVLGSALTDRDLAAVTNEARGSIESYFVQPDQQQSAALAVAAAHFSGRKRVSPRSLEREKVRVFPRLGLAVGIVDARGADALRHDRRVANIHPAAELSLIRPVDIRPARATASPSWGVVRLKVPTLWQHGIDGKGVVVGHLDTGVAGDHPALAGAISAFAEFDMAGNQVSGARPHDSGEHGTHTAGTIVGRPTGRGAFGVAPGARIASALVIEGGQAIDRILAGLEWIVGRNVRMLSMSLGLRGYTPAFQELIDALRRNNVLPVIAGWQRGAGHQPLAGQLRERTVGGRMRGRRYRRRFFEQPEVCPRGEPICAQSRRSRGRRPFLRAGREVRENGRDVDGHASHRWAGRAFAAG